MASKTHNKNNAQMQHPLKDVEEGKGQQTMTKETLEVIKTREEVAEVDYSKRAQWLRAAVLGASDGLLSTASLMMGVGAVREDIKTMVLTGVAGLVAGACGMAIGEFVSDYSQYDIEMSQINRENKMKVQPESEDELESQKEKLPNPLHAAGASALAYALGALVPLLAALFIKNYRVRVAVVIAVVSMALVGFGGLSAVLGKAPVVKSSCRVLLGGWLAMGITFGLTKLIGSAGLWAARILVFFK